MVLPTAETPTTAPPPPPSPAGTTITAPAPPRERPGGALKVVAIVAGAVVAGAILVLLGGALLNRVTGGDGVKYSDLKAGDCFERPTGRFKNVDTVPCEQDHDLEAFAVLEHPAAPEAPFPGMDELLRYASPQCLVEFQSYAGVPFDQLNLQDVYITPRESAWNDGARRVVCAVGPEDERPTKGSIKAGAPRPSG